MVWFSAASAERELGARGGHPADWLARRSFLCSGGASGATAAVLGLARFGSNARSTGQDDSRLITGGIYRWSRNPQVLGWFLVLLGVSLAGRSGLALLLAGVFAVILHAYTVRLEEPYLERVYGEPFRRYKAETPRYCGIRRKAEGIAERGDGLAGHR